MTLERELLDRKLTKQDPRSSVWKNAKDQLKLESAGKCGYCEGKASHVAHGDVEHFRPKTTYWWLAYCYENYVFACQICNQSHKGSNFPRDGAVMPAPPLAATASRADLDALAGTLAPDPFDDAALQRFRAVAASEQAGLPDPYTHDPNASSHGEPMTH